MPRKQYYINTYVGIIALIATILMVYLFKEFDISSMKILVYLSILSVITESLLIPLANGMAVSVGFAISLSAIMIGGPLTGAIVSAVGFVFRFPKVQGRGYIHIFNISIAKTLFNISQSIVVAGISGIAYVAAGGLIQREDFVLPLVPILVTLLTYVILNTTIVVKFIALINDQKFMKMWTNNIKGTIPNSIAIGALGIIISQAYIEYGIGAVILFFGPLLLARYSFKLYMDMKSVYMETIHALTNAMEAKDSYTNGHASRVGEYAIKLSESLDLPDKRIDNIKTAALLHDIGKIGIDDSILKKPGKLTALEFEEIQKHPVIGAQILKDVNMLKDVTEIIKYHHERYDGKGYPEGIKGENIPLEAAILSIADVFDAMTSDRPYREALTVEEALEEIKNNAGTQFHPDLAKCFIDIINKDRVRGTLADGN